MARIRTIKPDYWTDEKIGNLKRDERLLFIGLWNIADDQGVFKASPGYVKGQIFPYDDDLRIETVKEWLTSIKEARLIVPFEYNKESYYCIRTFGDHQLINRPSKEKFPKELINKLKGNTHGVLSEYSQPEVVSSKGKEIEVVVKPTTDSRYDRFYEMFSRVTTWDANLISEQVGKFMNKYPNIPINQSGALINAWAGNYKEKPKDINSVKISLK